MLVYVRVYNGHVISAVQVFKNTKRVIECVILREYYLGIQYVVVSMMKI